MKSKTGISLLILTALAAGCAAESPHGKPPALPTAWHVLPENTTGALPADEPDDETEARLAPALDSLLANDGEALDEAMTRTPKDLTRWHAEYFMTDVGLSASGALGSLVLKGSPAVSLYWQYQAPPAPPAGTGDADETVVTVNEHTAPADLARELEPSIRAAVSTGRIDDERTLRRGLLDAALELQAMGRGLAANPGLKWWVSRIRLDLIADVSGKLAAAPLVSFGGELRFRLEWHRVMRAAPPAAPFTPAPLATNPDRANQVRALVAALATDLEALSDETDKLDGFKAYNFRVGVGATASGTIGIVKASTSVFGIVYFSRDVPKPKVGPKSIVPVVTSGAIPMIIDSTDEAAIRFATANGIGLTRAGKDTVVSIDRGDFRKGMKKAGKMASFFAKRASKKMKRGGSWRVYELRTGLDLSVTGTVGLVGVGGMATSEISFYNQKF